MSPQRQKVETLTLVFEVRLLSTLGWALALSDSVNLVFTLLYFISAAFFSSAAFFLASTNALALSAAALMPAAAVCDTLPDTLTLAERLIGRVGELCLSSTRLEIDPLVLPSPLTEGERESGLALSEARPVVFLLKGDLPLSTFGVATETLEVEVLDFDSDLFAAVFEVGVVELLPESIRDDTDFFLTGLAVDEEVFLCFFSGSLPTGGFTDF